MLPLPISPPRTKHSEPLVEIPLDERQQTQYRQQDLGNKRRDDRRECFGKTVVPMSAYGIPSQTYIYIDIGAWMTRNEKSRKKVKRLLNGWRVQQHKRLACDVMCTHQPHKTSQNLYYTNLKIPSILYKSTNPSFSSLPPSNPLSLTHQPISPLLLSSQNNKSKNRKREKTTNSLPK